MNFIKSRLNKDNFWNLMFWVGMTIGLSITEIFGDQNPVAAFVSAWITILGMPYIMTKARPVTFDKNDGFFNSDGMSLKNSYPTRLGVVIFITLLLLAFIGLIVDSSHINTPPLLDAVFMLSFFILIPTLYFIYKNCPISILFNKHTWCSTIPGLENATIHTNSHFLDKHRTFNIRHTERNMHSDPSRSWMVGNMYHRK